jgi:hypothetical protein
MSYSIESIVRMFEELQVITDGILQLDLNQEEDIEQLMKWQTRQQQLRESITQAMGIVNPISLSETLKSIAFECLRLEELINQKISIQRDDLNRKIANIKMGDKAKDAYTQAYIQADGYFIDKHK